MHLVSHLFAACPVQSTTTRHHRRPDGPPSTAAVATGNTRSSATASSTPRSASALPGRQAVDLSGQNLRLKAAWTALGHPNLCGEGSPFCDATQSSNRQVVMSLDTPTLLICLSVALRGSCFSGCMQSHAPLSAQDEEHVAQLGGLTL